MATIFEKIIAREIPADIVYEDEKVLSFLDIRPANKGHVLVVAKEPTVNVFDSDVKILMHMMQTAQKIAHALKETTGADGVNIIMNNGEAAGQEVPHVHLHVIPRFTDDGIFQPPKHTSYTNGEAAELAEQIKSTLN